MKFGLIKCLTFWLFASFARALVRGEDTAAIADESPALNRDLRGRGKSGGRGKGKGGKTAAPTVAATCTPLGASEAPTAAKSAKSAKSMMGRTGGKTGGKSRRARELRTMGKSGAKSGGKGKGGKTAAPSFFCSSAPTV